MGVLAFGGKAAVASVPTQAKAVVRAYNSDVGYDSQIVMSGGGVTRQTAEEDVRQVT